MGLHRFIQLAAVATFFLLVAGALVTSTDSGLSVPDWPLSYGTLFPPMVGGIRYEHTHRMIAGLVGGLILVLAVWLWRREPRRWVRRLGCWALLGVAAQAVLGGITVLYQLPLPVSVAHACLGQLVFALVVAMAVVTSRAWRTEPATAPQRGRSLVGWGVATTAAVTLQLLLGAVMRHSGAGLTAHLLGAGAVIVSVVATTVIALRRYRDVPIIRRSAITLLTLLELQLVLGVLTAWVRPTVLVRTAHVVTGAALLATAVRLTLWAWHVTPAAERRLREQPADYLALTKPGLTLLAVVTAAVGFILGSQEPLRWGLLLHTLVGTALVGGGAVALNQYLERDVDARMQRTKDRPLPAGRITPEHALAFGVLVACAGLLHLAWHVNLLTSALGVLALGSYLFLYTPLKQRTCLCTLVGAIPGAIPPLMGWAAARQTLDPTAWVLAAILYLWQLPHFLAIAWLYREDYAQAGFRMLTTVDAAGDIAARQMALSCAALLPVTLLPTIIGLTGSVYFFSALVLGVAFFSCGVALALWRSRVGARRLFLASIAYLPLLLACLVLG